MGAENREIKKNPPKAANPLSTNTEFPITCSLTGKPNPVVSLTSVNQTSRKKVHRISCWKGSYCRKLSRGKGYCLPLLGYPQLSKVLVEPHVVLNNPLITKLAARLGVTDAPKAWRAPLQTPTDTSPTPDFPSHKQEHTHLLHLNR